MQVSRDLPGGSFGDCGTAVGEKRRTAREQYPPRAAPPFTPHASRAGRAHSRGGVGGKRGIARKQYPRRAAPAPTPHASRAGRAVLVVGGIVGLPARCARFGNVPLFPNALAFANLQNAGLVTFCIRISPAAGRLVLSLHPPHVAAERSRHRPGHARPHAYREENGEMGPFFACFPYAWRGSGLVGAPAVLCARLLRFYSVLCCRRRGRSLGNVVVVGFFSQHKRKFFMHIFPTGLGGDGRFSCRWVVAGVLSARLVVRFCSVVGVAVRLQSEEAAR